MRNYDPREEFHFMLQLDKVKEVELPVYGPKENTIAFPLTVIYTGKDSNGALMLLQANPSINAAGNKVWPTKPKTNFLKIGKALVDTWKYVPLLKEYLSEEHEGMTLHLMCLRDLDTDTNWVMALVSMAQLNREEAAAFSRKNYNASGSGTGASRVWDQKKYFEYCTNQNFEYLKTLPETSIAAAQESTPESTKPSLFGAAEARIQSIEARLSEVENRLTTLEIIALELSK